ncbi:MAG: alpha/beta fold hydrolase [Burkholderiaceae bacterium]|nr:alpha/beta fold hydrolase [Burkholderiaceae bacterium]
MNPTADATAAPTAVPTAAPTAVPTADATADRLAQAFLTPRRGAGGTPPIVLPQSRRRRWPTSQGAVAAVDAGAGPIALLVHGWEGAAADLQPIAQRLLAEGLRVVAIDLPAHGESDGLQTSIPASARALLALQRQLGSLALVVAHSVGAAVAVEAMALGLDVQRAVLLAAPAHYLDYARGFARQAGLDARQTEALVEALQRLGVDVRDVSMPARARLLRQPALFVHAEDDRIVPIADAVESSTAWPGATLRRVAGLGHRRLLADPAVLDAVAAFARPVAEAATA